MIYVYNLNKEDYTFHDNNYNIYRPNILSNPYSHLPEDKCIAKFKCDTREETLDKFSEYFDIMYGRNIEFTKTIDEIYEKYKNGEDIFLACFCKKYSCLDNEFHPDEVTCHGDIIRKKIEKMFIKEKFKERKEKKL